MVKLQHVVVVDGRMAEAGRVAGICEVFAGRTVVATTAQEAMSLCATLKPEMLILAVDLLTTNAAEYVSQIQRESPGTTMVLTFRELGLSAFQTLRKLNIADLLPQPVEAAALLRVVWTVFKIESRRHKRYAVVVDVVRADGVLLGRTRNLSAGGMLIDVVCPMASGGSLLIDLMLPGDKPLRARARVLAVEGVVPNPVWARLQFENLRGQEQRRLVAFLAGIAPADE